MKSKEFFVVLSAFLVLAHHAHAADIVASGTNCGSNCSWSLDSDGNVSITGTGTITSTPWTGSDYKAQVKNITTSNDIKGSVGCKDCANLETVTLGTNVTALGWEAFKGTQLKSITVPADSKLTTINEYAFYGTDIESITIPDTVTSIGGTAFAKSGLKSLTVPDSVTSGISCSGCSNLETVVLGKNVTSLGWEAFKGTQLKSITIPADSKLTTINEYAFYGTDIESITIPDTVTSIGGTAFAKSGLKSLTIPDSVTSGISCSGCSNLETVVLGKNVSSLGWEAFKGTQLKSITIPEDSQLTTINEYAFYGTGIESILIPNTVTSIGGTAFAKSGLKSLTIPDSVTSGISCSECSNLETVVLGKNVSSLGWAAFKGTQLKSIIIPEDANLKTIYSYAFSGTNIDSIVIPDSVTQIDAAAFEKVSLLNITCSADNLARYLAGWGGFQEGANITCTSGDCADVLKDTKWAGLVNIVYPQSGSQSTGDGGEGDSSENGDSSEDGDNHSTSSQFGEHEHRRIYTIQEANEAAGRRNSVMIRYR